MQLKTIQIIHIAFCTAVFLFAVVCLVVIKDDAYFELPFKSVEPINFIAPIVAVLGLIMSPILFKITLGDISQGNLEDSSKLVRYQTAFLIRMAFLESGALINIVACLITHNLFFMLFAAICFTAMLLIRPSKDRIYTTLEIQDTDLF